MQGKQKQSRAAHPEESAVQGWGRVPYGSSWEGMKNTMSIGISRVGYHSFATTVSYNP
jgi:hypothetical protein